MLFLLSILVFGVSCVCAYEEMLETRHIVTRNIPGYGGAYAGQVSCGLANSHCLYIDNGYTWGEQNGAPVPCQNADGSGRGYPTCQLPRKASAQAFCYEDANSYVDVVLDAPNSYFTAHGLARAVFSSQRANGNAFGTQMGQSNVPGDDVYVMCASNHPGPNSYGGVNVGQPTCDNAKGHCAYMTNAYTFGTSSSGGGGAVTCQQMTTNNQGYPTCAFPMQAKTRIFCLSNSSNYVDVSFGQTYSSFYAVGSAVAHFGTDADAQQGQTNQSGADVYVTC